MNYDSPEYQLAMRNADKVKVLQLALEDLLDILIAFPIEARTLESFNKVEEWRTKYKKSLL